MKVADNKIRIFFDYADMGLKCDGDELTHFLIADVNKNFVPAQAKIDGNTVLVWSDEVAEPIAVRFGWSNIAEPNLFNTAGLPASPFRTDNWE
jgi:sialate O-acetylesterase